jgi:hypothetical protein
MCPVYCSPKIDPRDLFKKRAPDPLEDDDGCGADVLPWPGERMDLLCPEKGCDGRLVLRSSKHGLFYGCSRYPTCKGSHGAHPDGAPLGTPADGETKKARIRAHAFFDRIWKDHAIGKSRDEAYAWLAKTLGVPLGKAHISMMGKDDCEILVEVIKAHFPQLVTVWDRLDADDMFDLDPMDRFDLEKGR